jgi:hypothetical protein
VSSNKSRRLDCTVGIVLGRTVERRSHKPKAPQALHGSELHAGGTGCRHRDEGRQILPTTERARHGGNSTYIAQRCRFCSIRALF